MKNSVFWIGLCSCIIAVSAFRKGAPQRQCDQMRPYHEGSEPQTGKSPYVVTFSKNRIAPEASVSVTISGLEGEKFKGYMIQAKQGNRTIGKFNPSRNIKLIDCQGSNTAATHTNNNDKSRVSFTWTAPKDITGTVVFKYTIVKDYLTYWVAEKSEELHISS